MHAQMFVCTCVRVILYYTNSSMLYNYPTLHCFHLTHFRDFSISAHSTRVPCSCGIPLYGCSVLIQSVPY